MASLNFLLLAIIFFLGSSLEGSYSLATSLSSLNQVQKTELTEPFSIHYFCQFGGFVKNLNLPQEYMKDDAYQLRYLSAKDFNVNDAFQRFQQVLDGRKAAKIDPVLEEDWAAFEKQYPVSLSGVTKDGSPILYLPCGQYYMNVEEGSLTSKKYERYFAIKITEEADRKAQSIRKSGRKDVSQFNVILDFINYHESGKDCLSCYRNIFKIVEAQYSEAIDNVYVINASKHLQAVFASLASALVEEKSRERVKVLGGWESFSPVLLQSIDLKDFPKEIVKE